MSICAFSNKRKIFQHKRQKSILTLILGEQMTTSIQIFDEIASCFQFANSENPSKVASTWVDSDQQDRTRLVYQNCVCCNKNRFNLQELSSLRVGDDTYFCDSCFTDVLKVIVKFEKSTDDEYKIFKQIWNNFLFGRS